MEEKKKKKKKKIKVEKVGKLGWLLPISVLLATIAAILTVTAILCEMVNICLYLLSLFGKQIPTSWQMGLKLLLGFAVAYYISKRVVKEVIIRVPYGEHWIIDRRGKIRVAKPGHRFFFRFADYEKIAAKIKTRQYAIHLFEDLKEKGEEIWVDLAGGGEILLKDPRFWIKVNDPLMAYTAVENFESQLREMVETRLTGSINAMTHEEIMELRVPRAIIKGERKEEPAEKESIKRKIKKKIDEIIQESKGIMDFLEEIGCDYKGFTFDDFDFDKATTQKRKERILTEMEKTIVKNTAEAKRKRLEIEAKARAAETIGTIVEMLAKARGKKVKEIRDEIDKDPELQKEFRELAHDLIIRKIGIEGRAYLDIRVGNHSSEGKTGEGGFLQMLIDKFAEAMIKIEAARQRMPMGKSEQKSETKKEREIEEEISEKDLEEAGKKLEAVIYRRSKMIAG